MRLRELGSRLRWQLIRTRPAVFAVAWVTFGWGLLLVWPGRTLTVRVSSAYRLLTWVPELPVGLALIAAGVTITLGTLRIVPLRIHRLVLLALVLWWAYITVAFAIASPSVTGPVTYSAMTWLSAVAYLNAKNGY